VCCRPVGGAGGVVSLGRWQLRVAEQPTARTRSSMGGVRPALAGRPVPARHGRRALQGAAIAHRTLRRIRNDQRTLAEYVTFGSGQTKLVDLEALGHKA
jgi:hypothetical protein